MKLSMKAMSAFLALLMANEAEAFLVVPSRTQQGVQLFGFRQSYQYNLEQLSRTGKIEVNGKVLDMNGASQMIEKDLQASKEEAQEAEARLIGLKTEMKAKETEQAWMIEALDAEMDRMQEIKAQDKLKINEEVIAVKLEAGKGNSDVVQKFQKREQALQHEIEALAAKLVEEEETIKTQHEMSNRILETRIELDRELSLLKKQYEVDSKEWERKLQEEKEANNRNLMQSQRELDQLHKEIAAMQKEKDIAKATSVHAKALEEKVKEAELISDRVLQERIKVDAEFETLKKQFESDKTAREEQIASEMSERNKEAEATKAEMEKMKADMEKMEAERNDAGLLFVRSMQVMFGVQED